MLDLVSMAAESRVDIGIGTVHTALDAVLRIRTAPTIAFNPISKTAQ